jgi:hypothetical protein
VAGVCDLCLSATALGVEEPGSIRGKRPSNQIRAENGFVYINIQILDFRVNPTV